MPPIVYETIILDKLKQENIGINENIRLYDLIDIVMKYYINKELNTNTKRIHTNSSLKIKAIAR